MCNCAKYYNCCDCGGVGCGCGGCFSCNACDECLCEDDETETLPICENCHEPIENVNDVRMWEDTNNVLCSECYQDWRWHEKQERAARYTL